MRIRRAAAAVELAVLIPFLTFVAAAALDYARVYRTSQALEAMTNAGAATAAGTHWVPNSTQSNIDAARAQILAEGVRLDPPLDASQISVTGGAGRITVAVEYRMPLILGVLYTEKNAVLKRTAVYDIAPRPGD